MSLCPVGTFSYTIQSGDTLWLLAQRYGTTVDAIIGDNPGIVPNQLVAGHVICIKNTNAKTNGISKAEDAYGLGTTCSLDEDDDHQHSRES